MPSCYWMKFRLASWNCPQEGEFVYERIRDSTQETIPTGTFSVPDFMQREPSILAALAIADPRKVPHPRVCFLESIRQSACVADEFVLRIRLGPHDFSSAALRHLVTVGAETSNMPWICQLPTHGFALM
jgi:hypothetical protein